ncbi:hypothetical protein AtubIFM56815_008592 [Aspergillus tubingensis]|uniref:Major facilitator superfamily (MFS) profile domain-containing protein n=2 Tax=Aspergillus tubingensis TaxID=5068 RepID=A0A9W6APJ8_ASPTU|nr:hypothetical protein AtubIFM56815_008592 [Aspergillus tubingensis]
MDDKKGDPENPTSTVHHLESPTSNEKQDPEVARDWTRDLTESKNVTTSTRLKNPLAGLTRDELFRDVESFARDKGLEHIMDELKRGSLVAQDPKGFESLDELSEGDKELLRREKTHRWSQPFMMYFMTILCAGSAVVQGMDQTAVNGAQEPFFVCMQVYFCPESPRWYMMKNRYQDAYKALCKLRPSTFQAARDLYYIHTALQVEEKLREGKHLWREMFTIPRNRRAAQSSFFVMFMQQFCGVNALMYYSSSIFANAGFDRRMALVTSLGCGITNWIFALPAVYTIDTFGRRNLLLTTFPLMSLFLLFTGFSFYIPDQTSRTACVATGIYLFMIVYSPGEGPVPFTYSAEAFPLYIRDVGMSFATATTWGFNFIVSLTWLPLRDAFSPQGAFGWYAAWNVFGWIFCYFCLPETKALSLEELDQVFSIPTRKHVNHYAGMLPWYVRKYILRGDVPPQMQLYDYE